VAAPDRTPHRHTVHCGRLSPRTPERPAAGARPTRAPARVKLPCRPVLAFHWREFAPQFLAVPESGEQEFVGVERSAHRCLLPLGGAEGHGWADDSPV